MLVIQEYEVKNGVPFHPGFSEKRRVRPPSGIHALPKGNALLIPFGQPPKCT
jgi:hypothetical protein